MLGRRVSSKVAKGALKRSAATSYRRGDDFKPRDDINLNDILIQACETHPDKTQVRFPVNSNDGYNRIRW